MLCIQTSNDAYQRQREIDKQRGSETDKQPASVAVYLCVCGRVFPSFCRRKRTLNAFLFTSQNG